jgi:hypothetical protein
MVPVSFCNRSRLRIAQRLALPPPASAPIPVYVMVLPSTMGYAEALGVPPLAAASDLLAASITT